MQPDCNERLTALESQLSHVERLYEQLNEVVTEQAMGIDRMERRISQLQVQFKEWKESKQVEIDPLDEKPPHY